MTPMLTCREVARAIATDELADAAWPRRLAVRLHLLGCRHCRRYASQIRAIGSAVRALFAQHETDPERLERLREEILGRAPGPRDSSVDPDA